MNWQWKTVDSIATISADSISGLISLPTLGCQTPFLSYSFLLALETNECVGANSGWQAKHIVIHDDDQIIAFIPGYLKQHSYGEYVFDHSWAHAYQQHGLGYYPKWINAIPFTPVPGARVLVRADVCEQDLLSFWQVNKAQIMKKLDISSMHFLFTQQAYSDSLHEQNFYQRRSVQFYWFNKQYKDFSEFLGLMTARRRKTINKERKSLVDAGISMRRIEGPSIKTDHLDVFYQCYQKTYMKRSGHGGYLNKSFFESLIESMPQNILLVLAYKSSTAVACALFFNDKEGLYGRYWGALTEISGLHFETCYYQGIEFCIENNIPLFNPGTQGEHKILRGFEPQLCFSNHSMAHPEFDNAVADFVKREQAQINQYQIDAGNLLPFKKA
ncbi:GNAT family N-acetyltransferase [Glaciecola petra]|uniref:GNAT family N-acetyltransferase n=1 Tax=Glaciecola petra TaxID=3075602 RepID=A0ABU2ZQG0_9ALTE|nr:GNAT family N-acetyltransferase [Aestuariibacter sp. P117]MDT0593839.1 GNAT family N-acetyltransferase [Aestuariibacter sp. P117]